MAEAPEEPESDTPPVDGDNKDSDGEGKGSKKLILFIAIPVVLLLLVGGGLFFTGTLDKMLGKGAATEEGAEAAKDADDEKGKGKEAKAGKAGEKGGLGAHFLQIPNMLVNLTSDGQPRYLKLSVQLELGSEEELKAVEAVMPRVIDQFQTYLRELRVKDLRGSAGIYRLQMELLARVNEAAYPTEVKDVLFQEILIQ